MTDQALPSNPKMRGRPRGEATAHLPRYWESDLYAMALGALPQHVEAGRLNPRKLAVAIDMHVFSVRKWFQSNSLSRAGAKKIIAEADGRLTPEDLAPFILN